VDQAKPRRSASEVAYRLRRWFVWSLVMALVPFGGIYVLFWIFASGPTPGLTSVIGSGQLLLTCVAILIGGVRELTSVPLVARARSSDNLMGLSIAVLMLVLFGYAGVNAKIVSSGPLPDEQQVAVALGSGISIAISLFLGMMAVWISTPWKEVGAT
jgi:hypothetical protein